MSVLMHVHKDPPAFIHRSTGGKLVANKSSEVEECWKASNMTNTALEEATPANDL